MPALKNSKHEAFAQAVFEGKNATEAYRTVYGDKPGQRTGGSRLLANRDIQKRIGEFTKKAADGKVMTKREEMEYLTRSVETPIGMIDQNSPLCQSYTKDADGKVTFKMVDKLKALELLIRMKAEFPPMEQAAPPPAPVNVSVSVEVMSEDRRELLMKKKREAVERRLQRQSNVSHN